MDKALRSTLPENISRRLLLQGASAGLALMSLPRFASAEGDPKYGGTFVVGCGVEPRHLNPNITTDTTTMLISNPVFSKLVSLNRDLTPSADLAKSWTVSADALEYRFDLYTGVKWHDGKPFTSEDVVYTLEGILLAHHNVGKILAPFVQSIEAPDPATLVIRLKTPNDIFMTFLGVNSYIQPKHVYAGTELGDNPANIWPIGTGPFKFESWERGSSVTLVRNEEYFLPDRPYVDRIVTRFIPEASARVRALQAGEVDYLAYFDLPPSSIEELRQDDTVTVVTKGHEAWGSIVELMLNLDKEPFDNLLVRRAITHAIDREFVIKAANFGLSKVATGPISSEIAWAYTPDTRQYPYDVAQANVLLDEAGLARGANGVRFEASIVVTRTVDANVKSAQAIAEMLREVGISVEVQALDQATVIDRVYLKREFNMFIQSLTTGPDPAMGVQRQYVTSNIRPVPYTNGIGYRNPEVDDMFAKAGASAERAERAEIYKNISKILCEDAAVVWLYENAPYSAFSSNFGNLHEWAAESIYSYGDVYSKIGTPTRG